MQPFKISVQEAGFSLEAEHEHLKARSRAIGAVVAFTGSVRDINEDDSVSSLTLEHYPGMTEKEISKILEEAAERWNVMGATVIHRVGELHPGDDIVLVAIASAHRGDAFHACEFVMDYLKTRATFWKKEQTDQGERWLTTRETDVAAAKNWQR